MLDFMTQLSETPIVLILFCIFAIVVLTALLVGFCVAYSNIADRIIAKRRRKHRSK